MIGFDRHLEAGRHELELWPPLVPDRERSEEEETERLLREYVRRQEAFVRAHPEQLFWMHRRWKSRPPEEARQGERR